MNDNQTKNPGLSAEQLDALSWVGLQNTFAHQQAIQNNPNFINNFNQTISNVYQTYPDYCSN